MRPPASRRCDGKGIDDEGGVAEAGDRPDEVRSATQRRLREAAANVRSTRSAGREAVSAALVVRTERSRVTPASLTAFMGRATWSRPALMPRQCRARQTLRTPQTPKLARWTRMITSLSIVSLTHRADGGRLRAA